MYNSSDNLIIFSVISNFGANNMFNCFKRCLPTSWNTAIPQTYEEVTHLSVNETEENNDLLSDTSVDTECFQSGISCGVECEFSKSSFDRFGDDLTEHIINYLATEDKFRFECLSKRIQSLIFNKQSKFVFKFDNSEPVVESRNNIPLNFTNEKQIENILIKFKALTHIEIIGKYLPKLDQILRVLADKCLYLRSLIVPNGYVTEGTIDYFRQKCGQNMKDFKIGLTSEEMVNRLLSWMPNLENVTAPYISSILTIDREWNTLTRMNETSPELRRLKTAKFEHFPLENELAKFVEEYSSVKVALRLDCIHKIEYSFDYFTNIQYLSEYLDFKAPHVSQLVAKHSPHLQSLKLIINSKHCH